MVPTCTGQWTDHGPAPLRQQTEIGSSGSPCREAGTGFLRDWKHKGQRCSGHGSERWDAGLGRTALDAVGLFSTNRNRVKVDRTSVENDP